MSDRLLKESDVLRIAFQLPLVVNSAFADAVKALPSADRPHGGWIYVTVEEWLRTGRDYGHHCSECDEINKSGKSNFCPNCGAVMK